MNGDISRIHFRTPGFEEDAKALHFTEKQASAILEMRLYKLIGLEILALEKEYKETLQKIKEYEKILSGRSFMDAVIKQDLEAIKAEFAAPRRTQLEDGAEAVYVEAPQEVREAVFVMDRFGYSRLLDRAVYERNRESVEAEHACVIPCLSDDRICLFTDTGALHQVRVSDIPCGKLRDKGTPIDNLSKFDGTREHPVYIINRAALLKETLLFATRDAMVKRVPGTEFETNNRTVAATKLQEGC